MEDNVMKAYINSNTSELRDWLKSFDLLPIDYPILHKKKHGNKN